MKMLKLLQEMRGFAEVTNRRRLPRNPGLFIMQLRSRLHEKRDPRQKLTILVDMREPCDIPHPVKIVHLRPESLEHPAPSQGVPVS